MNTVDELKSRAQLWPRGNTFEDFPIGREFTHHWGRTLTQMDSTLFTTLTLHYNPQYLNAEVAAENGYDRGCPINPLLVFNTVFGLSVEDLSEGGGPFLGVDECIYGEQVYAGDTLTALSEVISARESDKRPGFGIVTWATRGLNQNGKEVIRFQRTNLVRRLNT